MTEPEKPSVWRQESGRDKATIERSGDGYSCSLLISGVEYVLQNKLLEPLTELASFALATQAAPADAVAVKKPEPMKPAPRKADPAPPSSEDA
jgi:hypothetical protein